MIERVARALGGPYWKNLNSKQQAYYFERARAAIAAMREPTVAMCTAGYDAGMSPDIMPEAWQAMIDAALAATQEPENQSVE